MADPVKLLPTYVKTHEQRVLSVGDPGCEIVADDVVALRNLRDPFKARLNGLPWLAEEASADFWDPEWPEENQRRAIDMQWQIHRFKGTAPAVRFALALLGIRASIREWFNTVPESEPGTFEVIGELDDAPMFSDAMWRLALTAIERSKPLSRHFTLRLLASRTAPVYVGLMPIVQLTVTAYPFEFDPPVVTGPNRVGVAPIVHLFVTAYPKPELN